VLSELILQILLQIVTQNWWKFKKMADEKLLDWSKTDRNSDRKKDMEKFKIAHPKENLHQ
jgi:hypothetical protein